MTTERELAADTLRAWALDEDLKRHVMSTPALAAAATKVARRYSAGETIDDAIAAGDAAVARGHRVSIEYAGESVRKGDLARSEARVFLELAAAIAASGLPSTISFDLSHLGLLVDPELAVEHVRQLAAMTEPLGTQLMISAEGSDRTDAVLAVYERLGNEIPRLGITLQARLHRTPADRERALKFPGTIRLVKGAFLESESVAHPRGSAGLTAAYVSLAGSILAAGHPLNLATHDDDLVDTLINTYGAMLAAPNVEFEMLLGLGTELLDRLNRDGYATREYVIFGGEWWLYVLNRIAEQPHRVVTALADLNRG